MSRELYENIFYAYKNMLNGIKENTEIQKGLDVEEPEAKEDYSDDDIEDALAPVLTAIAALRKKGIKNDADKAIMKDLVDKKEKWENAGGGGEEEAPPEGEEEAPPEGEEEAPPEGEEEAPPEGEEEAPPEGEEEAPPEGEEEAPPEEELPDTLEEPEEGEEETEEELPDTLEGRSIMDKDIIDKINKAYKKIFEGYEDYDDEKLKDSIAYLEKAWKSRLKQSQETNDPEWKKKHKEVSDNMKKDLAAAKAELQKRADQPKKMKKAGGVKKSTAEKDYEKGKKFEEDPEHGEKIDREKAGIAKKMQQMGIDEPDPDKLAKNPEFKKLLGQYIKATSKKKTVLGVKIQNWEGKLQKWKDQYEETDDPEIKKVIAKKYKALKQKYDDATSETIQIGNSINQIMEKYNIRDKKILSEYNKLKRKIDSDCARMVLERESK
jgi:hypothetical protein